MDVQGYKSYGLVYVLIISKLITLRLNECKNTLISVFTTTLVKGFHTF